VGGIPWCSEGLEDPLVHLRELHAKLSTDNGEARARIDSYLLASYVSPKRPEKLFVLAHEDTFHYHNLPNLTYYLVQALATGDWGNNLISCFMAVFCIQVKKQKRNFQLSSLVEKASLINLLHGLLLGLYPYNIHHGTYEYRVTVVGAIRKVLTSDCPIKFILEHDSLIQIATVEYLANVVPDFLPVEEAILTGGAQSRFGINQVCESFRAAAMPFIEKENMWKHLNELATSYLSSVYRQLKVYNAKVNRRVYHTKVSNCMWSTLSDAIFFEKLMELPQLSFAGSNMIAQIKILTPDLSFTELQTIEFFWSNVLLSNLPKNSYSRQLQQLEKYSSCQIYQKALSYLNVCFPCALKSKTTLLTQKFAYNCAQNILQCATCSKKISSVNMLGRILKVRNINYCLCQTCLKPTIWTGSEKCQQCMQQSDLTDLSVCTICSKKTFEVIYKVLDLDALRIAHTPLCFQHAKHGVASQSTVYDTKSLLREFFLQ
jgi:hypothetical protein